jgi:ParB/RepB/Spo0J family partition protein
MASTVKGEGVKRGDLFRVPLDQVVVNHEENTRFAPPNREKLDHIKNSLRVDGQMEPAEVLLLQDGRVKLIDGHQRLTLLQELEAEDGIPRLLNCVLFKGNQEEAVIRSIQHNILRSDPSPMDNAKNIRTLKSQFGKTTEEIAKLYDKSPAWIIRHERLLSLPSKRQKEIHERYLAANAAFLLAEKIAPEMHEVVLQDAQKLADAEAGYTPEEATTEPVADAPVAEDAAPAGPVDAKKGKATKKVAAKKAPPKVTETHIIQAAAKRGVLSGDAPEMKMKEFKNYLQDTVDTEPTDSPIREIAKGLQKLIQRKLSQKQMDNLFQKYLLEPEPVKGGKK